MFTGLYFTVVLAGWAPRKLSPCQFFDGRIGLGTNPPPQFGHVFFSIVSTQVAQKVHSYVQMRASVEAGGKALLQCSHVGLSSSMASPFYGLRLTVELWSAETDRVVRHIERFVRRLISMSYLMLALLRLSPPII
jgi:hypothetical protein